MTDLSAAVLKTLAYADLFDFPLTLEEVHRFLVFPHPASLVSVKRALILLVAQKKIVTRQQLFFLPGHFSLAARRLGRQACSWRKLKEAARHLNWLRFLPGVKLVLLTGALANENATPEDDFDWLVVASANRLWTTRFSLVFWLELLGRRRRPQESAAPDKVCLNLFLTEKSLCLPPSKRNLFTAHELLRARPLWQQKNRYHQFLFANRWAASFLANAYSLALEEAASFPAQRPFFSFSLPLSWGNYLENLFFALQKRYMRARLTLEEVSPHQAFFHPRQLGPSILTAYFKKLNSLKLTP